MECRGYDGDIFVPRLTGGIAVVYEALTCEMARAAGEC